jgi:ABC-type lipoprotein release transport system permease subunit
VYAVKNLRRRSVRTILTVLGVALAIALTMTMFSISQGINTSTHETIKGDEIDLYVLPKDSYPLLPNIAQLYQGRTLANEMVKDPRIKAAAPRLGETLYYSKGGDDPKIEAGVGTGMVPEKEGDFKSVNMLRGQGFSAQNDPFYSSSRKHNISVEELNGGEDPLFTGEILINDVMSKKLDADIGDYVYVNVNLPGPEDELVEWFDQSLHYKVVGVFKYRTSDPELIVARLHLSEVQYLTGKLRLDVIHKVLVELEDAGETDTVKEWLETQYIYNEHISVFTQEDITKEIEQFTKIFDQFSLMVISITVAISILFISTIMIISVKERTREIGILKTIGFSNFSIFKLVIVETVFIGILGFLVGLVLGYGTLNLLEFLIPFFVKHYPEGIMLFEVTPGVILRVSLFSLLIGVGSGLLPAFWATRQNPAEIIRGE